MSTGALTKAEIQAEVERLAPFHHNMILPHDVSTFVPGKSDNVHTTDRFRSFVELAFPPLLNLFGGTLEGQRVLDVACNCGGFSLEAARHGAKHVLGFDITDRYLEQANFLKQAFNCQNVDFKNLSIEDVDESTVGERDITLCLGILYHLENPILAMKKLSSVTKKAMLVDTTVARNPLYRGAVWTMRTKRVVTEQNANVTTGMWRQNVVCQMRPNQKAVYDLLHFVGFPNVTRLKPKVKGLEKRFYSGVRQVFLATRD